MNQIRSFPDEASSADRPTPARERLSVVIPTCDEAQMIARCIASVAGFADEILVVDSGSKDATCEIAAAAGARVVHRPWPGAHALQKNAAMELVANDWCLHLDADEVVDRDLAEAILTILTGDLDPRDGYALERRGEFCGTEVPSRPRPGRRLDLVRLFNRRFSRFDPDSPVHETVVISGVTRLLPGLVYHWREFTLTERFAQNNKYATIEAKVKHDRGQRSSVPRLVLRPVARFFWHYVFDGSWSVGRVGLLHAMTAASAEFMREAKLWEMERGGSPPPRIPLYGDDATP